MKKFFNKTMIVVMIIIIALLAVGCGIIDSSSKTQLRSQEQEQEWECETIEAQVISASTKPFFHNHKKSFNFHKVTVVLSVDKYNKILKYTTNKYGYIYDTVYNDGEIVQIELLHRQNKDGTTEFKVNDII